MSVRCPSQRFGGPKLPLLRVGQEYWSSRGQGTQAEGQLLSSRRRRDPHCVRQSRHTCVRADSRGNLGNMDGKMTFRQILREASGINLHFCSTWVPLVIHGAATEKMCEVLERISYRRFSSTLNRARERASEHHGRSNMGFTKRKASQF